MADKINQLPTGLKWIRVIAIIFLILTIAMSFTFFLTPIKDFLSVWHMVEILVGVIDLVLLIVVISKPSESLYKITIGLLILSVASSLFYFGVYLKALTFDQNLASIITFAMLDILIDILIIWYLFKVKDYFITGSIDVNNALIQSADKKFKIWFIVILVLMFVLPFIIGMTNTALTISKSMGYVKEFQDKTTEQNIEYCNSQPAKQKDECLFYLAASLSKEQDENNLKICEMISDQTQMYGCYIVFKKCDLIDDESVRKNCEMKIKMDEWGEGLDEK